MKHWERDERDGSFFFFFATRIRIIYVNFYLFIIPQCIYNRLLCARLVRIFDSKKLGLYSLHVCEEDLRRALSPSLPARFLPFFLPFFGESKQCASSEQISISVSVSTSIHTSKRNRHTQHLCVTITYERHGKDGTYRDDDECDCPVRVSCHDFCVGLQFEC